MTRKLYLSQLTALALPPPQMLRLAADAGCDGAGIRLLPAAPGGVAYPLMDDPVMLRETLAAVADTGMRVSDLEMIRIDETFDPARYLPFLEAGARLAAPHVLVAGDDPDPERLTASFVTLCETARPFGLTADLEFMPWTAVPDLAAARRIVETADQPNGAVLVDALHFARSGSRLEDLDGLPRNRMNYAQICDGPAEGPATVEGLIHAARCDRLIPGEGGLDLVALFRRLPADLPASVEVPNDTRAPAMGWLAWARLALQGARTVLRECP